MSFQSDPTKRVPLLAPLVRGNLQAAASLREKLNVDSLLRACAQGEQWEDLRPRLHPYCVDGLQITALCGAEILYCEQGVGGSQDEIDSHTAARKSDAHDAGWAGQDRTLGSGKARLLSLTPSSAVKLLDNGAICVFVGIDEDARAHFGLLVPVEQHGELSVNCTDAPARFGSLRYIAHQLSGTDTRIALSLTALAHWHAVTTYCPRCSHPLQASGAGWTRVCQQCSAIEYPRQDPAMIVALTNDEGKILLAHNRAWPEKRVSVLAGFLDAGEAPEQAIEREIWEEVHLQVSDIVFQAAQPWPFPQSLMLGYTARVRGQQTLVPDTEEIEWARWYSPEEMAHATYEGDIILPGVNTIAYGLISQWYGGALPTPSAT